MLTVHFFLSFISGLSIPHAMVPRNFSPVDGHLSLISSFGCGANAVMYIPVHVFTWAYAFVSLGSTPRSETTGSHVGVCLTFKKLQNFFLGVAVLSYQHRVEFQLLQILALNRCGQSFKF